MPFIVPGVCRFTIEQEMEGNQIANVLDMRIDTTGSVESRDDAIFNQAGILINEWSQWVLDFQSNQMAFTAVRWLDLDSATGSTGSRTTSGSISLPQAGPGTGAPLPTNTSVLVRKGLESAGRGRRGGRMYVAGLVEAATTAGNGNVIESANVAAMNTSLASFLGDINQDDADPGGFQSALCVVHVLTRDADKKPLTGNSSDVGSLTVDPLLATQRRRLRR